MLSELKDRFQVTIPRPLVRELGLECGDMFDVYIEDGTIRLVPVVVYSKAEATELEALAAQARASAQDASEHAYDDAEDAAADYRELD